MIDPDAVEKDEDDQADRKMARLFTHVIHEAAQKPAQDD